MMESYDLLKSVLDTITEHIVVINSKGDILYVNKSWLSFAKKNACLINNTWYDINYLNECDNATAMGDDFAVKAVKGIRSVINAEAEYFYFEYPCHSPDEKRWFLMRVMPMDILECKCFVISHHDITERKLAEEKMLYLSRIDELTGLPNRRYFEEFFDLEWRRCVRIGAPISLAIIDLDHFKLLNDTYGHQAGDECLKSVSRVLKSFHKRPGDLCARYGGEEFAVVYGNTNMDQALVLVRELQSAIRALNIPNKKSPTVPTLTASIGLASIHPNKYDNKNDLIRSSDESLYLAKGNGRNQVFFKLDSYA